MTIVVVFIARFAHKAVLEAASEAVMQGAGN
jgi:hypothetical protein